MQEIIFSQGDNSEIRFEDVIEEHDKIYAFVENNEIKLLHKRDGRYFWKSFILCGYYYSPHPCFKDAIEFLRDKGLKVLIFNNQAEVYTYAENNLY